MVWVGVLIAKSSHTPLGATDYADNVGDEAKGEEQSFALRLRKLADTIVPAQQTS